METPASEGAAGAVLDAVPQFDGGPTVFVRNTFLDFDDVDADAMEPLDLRRLQTAPAGVSGVPSSLAESEDEEKSEASANDDAGALPTLDCADGEKEEVSVDDAGARLTLDRANGEEEEEALSPPNLERLKTRDAYEEPEYWGWMTVPVMMMPVPMTGPITHGDAAEGFISAAPSSAAPPPPSVADPTGSDATPSAGSGALAAPAPQTLERAFSVDSGLFRVRWAVDVRKLKSQDKQTVSPVFYLPFGPALPNVPFRLMIYPKTVNAAKGGASFKKARGRGYIHLKCEADLEGNPAYVRFRLMIVQGDKFKGPRGPVDHDFSQHFVAELGPEEAEWNFSEIVDPSVPTFIVVLELVPSG